MRTSEAVLPDHHPVNRASLLLCGVFLFAFSMLAWGASPLPTGFGTISVGTPWVEVESQNEYEDLSDASTLMERLSQECGYKTVVLTTGEGELLVTVNDFVVTELSYATSLERDSDLMAVADLVMQTYGQPKAATMRDAVGKATLDRTRVSHIQLEYDADNPVTFFVSGPAVWQYQINVRYRQHRWHQNKTARCARTRAKALHKEAEENQPKAEPKPAKTDGESES